MNPHPSPPASGRRGGATIARVEATAIRPDFRLRWKERYRSPSWDFSENTPSLLAAAGPSYSSNMMDDIRPYRHSSFDIIELPAQWILDDAPQFWFDGVSSWSKRFPRRSRRVRSWEQEFLGIHELGGLTVLTMHPQIIGRPGRLRMLDGFIDFMTGISGVEVARAKWLRARAKRVRRRVEV